MIRHGHARRGNFSPEYHSWASMWTRCTNPNRSVWRHYGGKGVTVCDAWRSFEQFLADMGPRPAATSLERLDGNLGYGPGNCVWAERQTQNRNTTQVVWVELDGRRQRLVEWCTELGLSINTVRDRVKRGATYQEALRPSQFWRPKRS